MFDYGKYYTCMRVSSAFWVLHLRDSDGAWRDEWWNKWWRV